MIFPDMLSITNPVLYQNSYCDHKTKPASFRVCLH